MARIAEIRQHERSFEAFLAALRAENLPADDLFSEPYVYFEAEGFGWGGLGFGPDALLRSIVVPASARGAGKGAALVESLANEARRRGALRLWLLTMTASGFFAKLGWREVARDAAPASIAASRQFTGVCPASAKLMMRALEEAHS